MITPTDAGLIWVLGASPNPARYSYRAMGQLLGNGYSVYATGRQEAEVFGLSIHTDTPAINSVHTLTLYLRPALQASYKEAIVHIAPQRVIFNPGTENDRFRIQLEKHGIKTMEACTLVLLATAAF